MNKLLLRCTLILINVFFLTFGAFAQFVSSKRAKNVVVSLFNERKPINAKMISEREIQSENLQYYNGVPVFYVYNLSNNAFVIISADERVYPVLGYSFQNNFEDKNVSDCLEWLLNSYKEQIHDVVSLKLKYNDPETKAAWEMYEDMQKKAGPLPTIQAVNPLTTTNWSQGCYYNDKCPSDNTLGTIRCGKVPTGCVATAFGQVLKYHNHPAQGTGSRTYTSNYGPLTANFGATTYNWSAMPNKLLANNFDVAQLLSHTGIAVKMAYTANSSAAFTSNVATALVNNFKYAKTTKSFNKSSYTNTQWDNLIRTELDAQRIVIISGHDPVAKAGHAFIADGYQGTNSFHINWGWNGSSDGYFLLNALSPGSYSFNSNVAAIIGIKPVIPATTCPAMANLTSSTITSTSVTINWTAGSSSNTYNVKYKPASSSTWTTLTSSTNSITITGLLPSTSYQFQVQRVCSSSSSSNYTSSLNLTTLAAPVSNATLTLGTGTSTTGIAPYGTASSDERTQFIITKSQLLAAGYSSLNNYIESLAFNLSSASTQTMNAFTIKIGHTTASSFSNSSFLNTSMNTVYSGNVNVTTGWKTHTFTTPFLYDGNSNLLVEICWNNSSFTTNSNVYYTTTTSYQTLYYKANSSSGGVCNISTGSRSYNRPNMKFVFSSSQIFKVFNENEEQQEELVIDNSVPSILNIFPNPAQNTATIRFDGLLDQTQISVLDMMGKLVFSDKLNTADYQLEVENYAPGIYMIVIQNQTERLTRKLLVKKSL